MKKIWKYPDEVVNFVQEHGHEGSIRDMVGRLREEFGLELSYQQMKTFFANHKIHAAPMKGRKHPEKRITTPEVDAFILEHHKGTGYQEMADMVNDRFGTSYTANQMNAYYGRNHLDSGLTGRFEKGHIPQNKGRTWDDQGIPKAKQEKMLETAFKKGHTPHNGGTPVGTPVGTVRLRHDHRNRGGKPYYWEKVEQPNVWRMAHVLEWERHNGPVPEGCMVTFANGDTLNYGIDNLILETKAQHAVKNRWDIHGYDVESAEAANKIADIKMAINKRKRKRGGKQ